MKTGTVKEYDQSKGFVFIESEEGEDLFVCDGHGWQYEKSGGSCPGRPDFRMKAFLVTVQENRIVALVPDE